MIIIYISMTYFYVPISVIGIMIYVFLKLSGDLKVIQTEYYRIKFEIPSMNSVDVLINEGSKMLKRTGIQQLRDSIKKLNSKTLALAILIAMF